MKKKTDIDFPNTHWAYVIATWFWVGKLKPMPGTWGSLAALPFGLILLYFTGAFGLMLSILLLTWLGAKAIEHIESHTDRAKTHDASCFVVDEVVGQWIVLLVLPYIFIKYPALTYTDIMLWTFYAFIGFRFFDILKFPPAKQIDALMHTGWGVMLDDVIAGIQALITLAILFILFYESSLFMIYF